MSAPATGARVSWWAFAFRNLIQAPRRTAFTAAAIALGYAAVTVFGGFATFIFTSLAESQIYATAEGHLGVFKPDFFHNPKAPLERRYFTDEEMPRLKAACEGLPGALVVTGGLGFRGLLSNGDISTIFMGVGKVWSDVARIRAHATGIVSNLELFHGEPLKDERPFAIGVGAGLGRTLRLGVGDSGIALAPTLEGHINALDAEIVQITDVPSDWLESVMLVAPLEFAQTLYDTQWIDHMSLLLERDADVDQAKAELERRLAEQNLHGLVVLTWRQMSAQFVRTEQMFQMILLFVFAIILLISVLIVVNTTTMAVTERTREIGTLRALGVKRRGIVAIFTRESALLGMAGSALGALITTGIWAGVRAGALTWTPPTISRPIPFLIEWVPLHHGIAVCGMVAVSVLAALIPARRAARMSVVDALGHV